MASAGFTGLTSYTPPALPDPYLEPRWYAAYTCANHEKRVASQFSERGIEHFLPLYHTVHRWKDRRVQLQLPLIPGYVFVHLPLREGLRALQVSGVVHLVSFGSLPVALSDSEIESLRGGLAQQPRVEPHPYLRAGRRVRITAGPFSGSEGILLRRKGAHRVVLSLDLIMRSLAVEVDLADVKPLS